MSTKETKLKITRQQNGLTQKELAEKAKVSIRAYQQYESGKRFPNAIIAKLIAKALNSTVEELF